jgi:hypothetical protein
MPAKYFNTNTEVDAAMTMTPEGDAPGYYSAEATEQLKEGFAEADQGLA